jgi:hypothetical protein
MLKFENTANVGDVIKAYDFEPMSDRPDSYLIGRVMEKGPIYVKYNHADPEDDRTVYMCDGYTVFVKESQTGSFEHDVERTGITMYVPFEMAMSDFDGRVEVINEVS